MKGKVLLFPIMLLLILMAAVSTAFAVEGNTSSTEVFHVHSNYKNSSLKLEAAKGTAYVEKGFVLSGNPGRKYKEKKIYGFYKIHVLGPGKQETIEWAPSASIFLRAVGSGFESGSSLKLSFPAEGDYTVRVEPMENSKASSEYWLSNHLLYWIKPAAWNIVAENGCSADYASVTPAASSGVVHILCNNDYGAEIYCFDQEIYTSTTIDPPTFSGYTTLSNSTYVHLDTTTGFCSPSTIYFYYAHNSTFSIPQLPTDKYAVWLRNPNVERIQPQCGPGRNYSVFASMNGTQKLYAPQNITYMKACFCVDDWVYLQFGYTDKVIRFGFFEKSLFNPSVDWSVIPGYSLTTERNGRITRETTPYNGPARNCGSYESCKLYPGNLVHACMEYNGWYFCRFNNDHDNNYGDVYLWVPGSSIQWE